MKPTLIVAALAMLALLGGAMVGIVWTTSPDGPAPSAPLAAAAPTPEPAAAVPAPLATAPAVPPRTPARRSAPARARWKAPAEDPHPIPMADRVTRKSVRRALHAAAVRSGLARCADRELGFGGGDLRGRIPRAQPAVLLLELEAHPGEVRIVETHVQSWGGASARSVSCAQDVLRGRTIASTAAEAAGRVRMPLTLNPRSGALVSAR